MQHRSLYRLHTQEEHTCSLLHATCCLPEGSTTPYSLLCWMNVNERYGEVASPVGEGGRMTMVIPTTPTMRSEATALTTLLIAPVCCEVGEGALSVQKSEIQSRVAHSP